MDFTALQPYARRFAEALLRHFPEWSAYVQVGCEEHGADALLVTVPSPAAPSLFICVGAEDAEIWWDRWHCHAKDLEDSEGLLEDWPATFRALEEVLADRAVIAVAMLGEEWKGSSLFPADVDADDAWLDFITGPGDFDRCYAVSWTGIRNRNWSVLAAPAQ